MKDALVAEIKTLVAISDSKRCAVCLVYRKFPFMPFFFQRICIDHYLSPNLTRIRVVFFLAM